MGHHTHDGNQSINNTRVWKGHQRQLKAELDCWTTHLSLQVHQTLIWRLHGKSENEWKKKVYVGSNTSLKSLYHLPMMLYLTVTAWWWLITHQWGLKCSQMWPEAQAAFCNYSCASAKKRQTSMKIHEWHHTSIAIWVWNLKRKRLNFSSFFFPPKQCKESSETSWIRKVEHQKKRALNETQARTRTVLLPLALVLFT